jgi:hypothetical protein
MLPVSRAEITSYFSPLSVFCGDKYVAPDVADFRSTADDCGSPACKICGQDELNEKCEGADLSFSSAPTAVGTPEGWIMPSTPEMPFPMDGFFESEGGGKKMVRWSSYKEEVDSSNRASYELMPDEQGSSGQEERCASPVRDLVLDGAGSSYVVPAVLSYVSSAGEKVESEPWDGDAYLYAAVIPGTYGAAMSYALWYKKMNGDCSCQECKKWCRYWWDKVMERGWDCLMLYTTAR